VKRLLAVLGSDVSKSLSPFLHSAAAEACDLDVAYVPISCRDVAHFDGVVAALQTIGALGCNITIPYKPDAMRVAEDVSDVAAAIGVVNTLCFEAGRPIRGDNTDGPGLQQILEALAPEALSRVQILGSGGVARAAAWAVARLETESIAVCARRPEPAEAVAALCRGEVLGLAPVSGSTLVISSVPGTDALADRALAEWIDTSSEPVICDLAYGGLQRQSPLVEKARALGLEAFDGRGMLVEQAALALALWTGGEVPAIRAAMYAALAEAEAAAR